MDRLFLLSLCLPFMQTAGIMEKDWSCSIKPQNVIRKTIGLDVVLPCRLNCSAPVFRYEWFAFKRNNHFHLNLGNPRYQLEGASLHIKSLDEDDSAIYVCAVVLDKTPQAGAQHVGLGTTLVVKEKLKKTLRFNSLWAAFVLLAIYSSAILALIILKKCGYNTSTCKRLSSGDKKNISKRAKFQDVMKEMKNRTKAKDVKTPGSRNHSHTEASGAQVSSSTNDIYQNI